MKKKYKVIVSSTALGALLATGVLATAISCGTDTNQKKSQKVDKQANKIKYFEFNNKKFDTFKAAEKAQKDFIDSKIKEELKKDSNKLETFKYKGKEYLTKDELFKVMKNDMTIKETYFDNSKATLSAKNNETFKDIKNKQITKQDQLFVVNNKAFKNKKDAILEYFKGDNGDKTGKTFSEKLYDKTNKKFGKKGSIIGLNKKDIAGKGVGDNKIYVTKPNIKSTLSSNVQSMIISELLKGLKVSQYTPKYTIKDHSKEIDKYKKEFLQVIDDMKYFRENEGYEDFITNSLMAENNIPVITLPSGTTYNNTKLFLAIATFKNKIYKATTIRQMVEKSTNVEDLNYLWDLMKSVKWGWKTDNAGSFWKDDDNGFTSFREIIEHFSIYDNSAKRFKRYVKNDVFNFERKLEVNGKWFNSKLEAQREVKKLSENQTTKKVDSSTLDMNLIKKIDRTKADDLKTILKSEISASLKSDIGSKNERSRGMYISSKGLAPTNPLKSIDVNSKLPLFDLLKLINKTTENSKLKLIYDFIKNKTIESQDISKTTILKLDSLKYIFNGKTFTTQNKAFMEFALNKHLNGVFINGESSTTPFDKIANKLLEKTAIENSKKELKADPKLELFDFETGNPSDSKKVHPIIGKNTAGIPGIGDKTGNTYVKVKVDESGNLGTSKTIIGKNYSEKEISAELDKKVEEWKNPATKNNVIKKILLDEALKANVKNIIKGRAIVNKTGSIEDNTKITFDPLASKDKMMEQTVNIKKTPSSTMFQKTKIPLTKEKFINVIKEEILATKIGFIDEFNINPKDPEVFKDVDLPPMKILGPNGSANIVNSVYDPDIEKIFNVKRSNKKEEDITGSIANAKLKNGDVLKIIFQKGSSFITRTRKISGLKLGLIDFFKSDEPKIEASKKIILDKVKEQLKDLLPTLEETFTKLGDNFKDYISTKVADRTVAKKRELAKAIQDSQKILDNNVFEKIASRKDSILNTLVKELYKNDIFINSISKNGIEIKEGIKNEINDLLDIFKVIIDHTFEFMANSIHWEKNWLKTSNFLTKTSSINLKITKLKASKPAAGSDDAKDLKFLEELNKNGKFFSSTEEQKNTIFKTTEELMKDKSEEYKIYKEKTKDGKIIYHLIKNVNARKITNIFRKNFDYTKFDKAGTIDNIGIQKGKTIDNFVKDILAKAKARQDNNWSNLDPKNINIEELYKNKSSTSSGGSGGMDIGAVLPLIKGLLGNSISSTIKNMGSTIGKAIGVSGIQNLPEIFNSLTSSGSDVLIGFENNILGLLTYLMGDQAKVVIDIQQNKDGKFELKNYYSPQIRVLDKANNDKIVYRKDNLDEFFNRLKPFMDLVFEFLGTMGK